MNRNQRMSKAFKAKLFGTKPTPRPKSVDPRRPYVKRLRDALRVSEVKLEEVVTALVAESGEGAGAYLAWAAADLKTTPEQCVLFLNIMQARGLMFHPTSIMTVFDLARDENEMVRKAAQAALAALEPKEEDRPAPPRRKKNARTGNTEGEEFVERHPHS